MRWKAIISMGLALTVFVFHGAFVYSHSSGENSKIYVYQAEKVNISPIVDGMLDEPAWQDVEKAALEWDILKDQQWKDAKDFKGSFAALWKGNKLYVALWLEDDHIDTSSKVPLEADSIELYIDQKPYAGEIERYIIISGQKRAVKEPKNLTATWSGDGRNVEFVVELGTAPKIGETIGFDIYYNDAETSHREDQIGWTPGDNAKDGANLGELVFVESKRVREKRLSTTWGSIKTLY